MPQRCRRQTRWRLLLRLSGSLGRRGMLAAALERHHHHEATLLANAPGNRTGILAGAEVKVGAGRTDDRRAGVLRDHEATEIVLGACAVDRQLRLDEKRRAVDVNAIDRDRTARRQ